MFSYPLQVHPCRASIDAVLKWRPERFRSSRDSVNGTPSRAAPLLSRASGPSSRNEAIGEVKFALITTIILVLSYIVAVMVSSLDKVLAYVGSTGSTSISFILPGLFYYKISAPESLYHQRLTKEDDDEYDSNEDEGLFANGTMRPSPWRQLLLRRLALGLSIYGALVMIICFITNIFFSVSH
jgi:amino acid permease